MLATGGCNAVASPDEPFSRSSDASATAAMAFISPDGAWSYWSAGQLKLAAARRCRCEEETPVTCCFAGAPSKRMATEVGGLLVYWANSAYASAVFGSPLPIHVSLSLTNWSCGLCCPPDSCPPPASPVIASPKTS